MDAVKSFGVKVAWKVLQTIDESRQNTDCTDATDAHG